MKHFSAKRWLSLLLITSILAWLLVYLVACTQTGGGVRTLSAEPQETVADIDLTATQAAKTIEAVLQTSAAVTPMPVATPTPPPTATSEQPAAQDVTPAPPTVPAISAVINVLVVGTQTLEALMKQSVATDTPQPTATPNLPATATVEEQRVEFALAATLTAQPTATPTIDSAATATTEAQRLATAVAATLTAQPTATPSPLPTATWTATPDLLATATTEAQRLATAVAATLTAQPTATATATPTGTPTPTATATWTPLPTATPTPDFAPYIAHYRQAERAALQTLSPDVLAQMPIFAHGEALEVLTHQVEALRNAGQYQILVVENMKIEQVLLGETTGVLVTERHNLQTFTHAADGDRLLENKVTEVKVVYGFVFTDGRWKVEKVRIVGAGQ